MKGAKKADNISYESVDNRFSDHRPVIAHYQFKIPNIDLNKKEAIKNLIID